MVVCNGVSSQIPLCVCCLALARQYSARSVSVEVWGVLNFACYQTDNLNQPAPQRQPSFPFSHFDDKLCSDIRQGILDPLWVCEHVWMCVREHCGLSSQRVAVLRETDTLVSLRCQPHRSSHMHLHTLSFACAHTTTAETSKDSCQSNRRVR